MFRTIGCLVLTWPLALAPLAKAVTLSTADSPFNAGQASQGWWSSHTTSSGLDNYYTGSATHTGPDIGEYRGFFTFDLSSVNSPVAAAKLLIHRLFNPPGDAHEELLGVFDVSTPAAALNAKNQMDLDIFADLGAGVMFASRTMPADESPEAIIEIELNPAGVAAVNASRGGYFSVGTSLLTLDLSRAEGVFGESAGYANSLELTLVPEPVTLVLVALGLGGVALIRRVLAKSR
jgi:hypothetical protein